MQMYCVKCKCKSEATNLSAKKMKNGAYQISGVCGKCKKTKVFTFCKADKLPAGVPVKK